MKQITCVLVWVMVFAAATLAWAQPASRYTGKGNVVRIVAIYGARTLEAGAVENYRVRLAPGAKDPIAYYWDFGDGTYAEGNHLALRFHEAGRHVVAVTARNRYSADTDTMTITVTASAVSSKADGDTTNAERAPIEPVSTEPSRTPARKAAVLPASLYSPEGLAWVQGGYTWVAATSLYREAAELDVLRYRKQGYRTGLYVDNTGSGSTAYRVVLGQFKTTREALQVRRLLPGDLPVLLLDLPRQPKETASNVPRRLP